GPAWSRTSCGGACLPITTDCGPPPWRHPARTGARSVVSSSMLAALLVAVAVDAGPDAGAEDAGAVAEAGADAEVHADADAEGGVSVAAEPPASAPVLSGRVLARGTRDPLVAAQVRVILSNGASVDTETDESGGFTLTVRPGPCELRVHSAGFEPFSRRF